MTIPHTETKSGIVYGQAERYTQDEWAEKVFGRWPDPHRVVVLVKAGEHIDGGPVTIGEDGKAYKPKGENR